MAQWVKKSTCSAGVTGHSCLILRWEDPLDEEMATHSSILAWRIPWTEEPGRLQFMGSQRAGLKQAPMHMTITLQYFNETV